MPADLDFMAQLAQGGRLVGERRLLLQRGHPVQVAHPWQVDGGLRTGRDVAIGTLVVGVGTCVQAAPHPAGQATPVARATVREYKKAIRTYPFDNPSPLPLAANPDIDCMVGFYSYNPPRIYEVLKESGKLGEIKVIAPPAKTPKCSNERNCSW